MPVVAPEAICDYSVYMTRVSRLRSDLEVALDRAKARVMTPAARERQLVSFAYGNARLENDRVTRPLVSEAAASTTPRTVAKDQ